MLNLNFIPFPVLETERFVLRALRPEDDREIFILRTDKAINEFIDRQPPASIEETRAFINTIHENILKEEAILWAISFKGQETLAGTICLWKIDIPGAKAELGYELLPQYHGKGIMQEVIPAVLKFGFERIGLQLIEAELDKRNIKSLKLLQRNGFVLTEHSGNENFSPMVLYSLKKHSA
ncbi:MAG TPA: GNAT family N-acetyltransferase [Chitinophagaceae bacterium]|nr:GNAT family N-acetyltransferase [Chitinophagaceae bacterium]